MTQQTAEHCEHKWLTSTFERGVHCCECKEPLISFFWPVSRNTPVGALLYAMYKQPPKQEATP